MGQFFLRYRGMIEWSFRREIRAWINVILLAFGACVGVDDDRGLVRRGNFVKQLALRIGFMETYWSQGERKRWRHPFRESVGEIYVHSAG